MDINYDRKERACKSNRTILYIKKIIIPHKNHSRFVNKPAKAHFRAGFHVWTETQTQSNTQSLTLLKIFKLTNVPVLSVSFPELHGSNNNIHLFMGRICIPLEPANTALIAAGEVVLVPAHHQLTPQENWRESVHERESVKPKPSNIAAWWGEKNVGRITSTPGKI